MVNTAEVSWQHHDSIRHQVQLAERRRPPGAAKTGVLARLLLSVLPFHGVPNTGEPQ